MDLLRCLLFDASMSTETENETKNERVTALSDSIIVAFVA